MRASAPRVHPLCQQATGLHHLVAACTLLAIYLLSI